MGRIKDGWKDTEGGKELSTAGKSVGKSVGTKLEANEGTSVSPMAEGCVDELGTYVGNSLIGAWLGE